MTFSFDRPSQRKHHIICGYCGLEVHERGLTSHQRGLPCRHAANVREVKSRGLALVKPDESPIVTILARAHLLERHATKLCEPRRGSDRLEQERWAPPWALSLARAWYWGGASSDAIVDRLIAADECEEERERALAMVELGS